QLVEDGVDLRRVRRDIDRDRADREIALLPDRDQLVHGVGSPGAMATVELPAKQVLSELTMRSVKDVVIAVVASPQSTVIAGA
ncbi:hypothetical protein C6A85_13015, partial [Mycobacterium sp. ITM-2017-0098]